MIQRLAGALNHLLKRYVAWGNHLSEQIMLLGLLAYHTMFAPPSCPIEKHLPARRADTAGCLEPAQ